MNVENVLEQMRNPSTVASAPKAADIYTEKDPIVRLDDGSFILSRKIRPDSFEGPGLIEVYAPWCPYCQSKVAYINILADRLRDEGKAVYVIDGTENPHFRYAHNITGYPTFLQVLPDGSIGVKEDDVSRLL